MISDLIGKTHEEMNCWELVLDIYSKKGLRVPDYNISSSETSKVSKAMMTAVSSLKTKNISWEKIKFPEKDCLVAIRLRGKIISHCGVCLGDGKFIHSLVDAGVVVSRLSDPRWKMKIEGFYRYVG